MMSPEELCASHLETVPEYSEEIIAHVPLSDGVCKPKRKFGLPSYLLQARAVTQSEDSSYLHSMSLEEEGRGERPLTPPTNRKGILETFRPRSKSDVTYKSKRPSFLNQLKRKNVSFNQYI